MSAGPGGTSLVSLRSRRRSRVGKTRLVASTARGHSAGRIGHGASARRLRGGARSVGPGVLIRGPGRGARLVYGVSGGRVRYVAVAARSVAGNRTTLRRYLRLARLR